MIIFKTKGLTTLFLFLLFVLCIGKTDKLLGQERNILEVVSFQLLPNELIDKQDQSNYDVNGILGVGIKVQSNLSGLNFQSPNGIIKTEKNFENEWLILLSESEREITIYAEGYFPFTVMFTTYDVKLESGKFYDLKIKGQEKTLVQNKLTNEPSESELSLNNSEDSVLPPLQTIPNARQPLSYMEIGILSRIPKNQVFVTNFYPSIGIEIQYYLNRDINSWSYFYINGGYNFSQYSLKNPNLLQEGKQFYHSELNSGLGIRIKVNTSISIKLGLGGNLSQLIIRDDIFESNDTEVQKEKQYLHLINYDIGLEFRKWHFYIKPSFISYPENLNQITTGIRFKLISGS